MKLPFLKNKTQDQVKLAQFQGMLTFSEYHKVLEEITTDFKHMTENCCEEELRKFYKMGYKQELGWCLDVINSLKRLSQSFDKETKQIENILKNAKNKYRL